MKVGRILCINQATYLAGFDLDTARVVVDDGEVVFCLLFISERNPIHIRDLSEVIVRPLVLSDPLVVRRSLNSDRGICGIIHRATQSVIEHFGIAFEVASVAWLLVSIDAGLAGVGSAGAVSSCSWRVGNASQNHEGLVVHSVADTCGVTYTSWESAPDTNENKWSLPVWRKE